MKPGTPLVLTLLVSRLTAGDCQPLPGAQVDIWHCDALGVYSDVRDFPVNSIGQKFLRGYQVADVRGAVQFVTVYSCPRCPTLCGARTTHGAKPA